MILQFDFVFETLLLFIRKFMDCEQFLCKMLQTKKRIREAPRLTSVKKKYSTYVKVFKCLPEIPEAHILLYSPWARGVGPSSLIKIENAIYTYINKYIYIYICKLLTYVHVYASVFSII